MSKETKVQKEQPVSNPNEIMDLAKPDPELKEFFRNPEHFADLFNGSFFHGEQVLTPDTLTEIDTDASGVIAIKEYRESLIRNRDILKKAETGTKFVILGVENQMSVDYTMPLRIMVYDGMNYLKELKESPSKKKEDQTITPIVTIVMYYGSKPWDGPRSLKDMMREIPSPLEEHISDYKMHLIEVLHDEHHHFANDDVQMLFEYSQAITKKDQVRIRELNEIHKPNKNVLFALGKIIDLKEAKLKLQNEKVEELDMCELFDDIRNEGLTEGLDIGRAEGRDIGRAEGRDIGRAEGRDIGRAEGRDIGRAEGIIRTLKNLNFDTEEILKQLSLQFEISREDALKFL